MIRQMGQAGEQKYVQGFDVETWRKVGTSKTWECLGNNIKMKSKEILRDGVDWIHLAQVTDKWRAVVKMRMNIWMS